MSAKTVLVINLGWEQEPLIRRISALGYRIVGIHPDDTHAPNLPVEHVEYLPLRDLSSLLAFASRLKPAAVMSDQCDYSYFAVATIAERLGLPGPRIAEAQIATNKALQRQKGLAQGVLQPRFQVCSSVEEARAFARAHGFPIILKPIDNRGSFGVRRVDHDTEIEDAYFDALVNAHSRMVLAEEFIHGTHITVDGYLFPRVGHRSLSLATKGLIGGTHQVAVDILYPGELPNEVYQQALTNNDAVVEKLGYRFGFTHAEYMVDEQGNPYLIEIANRGGGCFTSAKIVPAVSGLDLTTQLIFDSLGVSRDLYEEKGGQDAQAAYLKFFVLPPGRIARIEGSETISQLAGIEALHLRVSEGSVVSATTSDADRHGFVIATADSREQVKALARQAIDMLKVTYDA